MTMPQMTSTIDYKALAERVAQRAIYADNNADQNNKTWAADLRTVVSLLNGMAGQKPFAWAIRDGWSQTRFSVDPDTPILGTRRADYVVDALYLHPAPSAPQAEQPIDLDAVAMQQMRQAAAESTWMPAEYSGSDWISDVCRWLRDGPPQAEPKREPLNDDAISYEHACRSSYESACAASDFDSFKLGVRFAERAHRIGGSDAE